MSTLRSRLIEDVAVQLAMELGHTLASVEPPKAGPNTRRIATIIVDRLLDTLAENADEWYGQGADYAQDWDVDTDHLIAVLRERDDQG